MPSVSSPLRVFVSHSSKDHAFATQLVRDLQAALGHEHTVWYDEHSLTGGDEWWPMIVRELNQCNVFVVILSPDAMKSRWVLDEINIAWKRKNSPANIRFIPLLHFPCNVRGDLETLQIISFLAPKPYDVAFKELLKAIQPLSKALRPRSAADNRLSSSLEQPISFTLFSYLSRRHEEQLWAEAQEEGIHSVVEEVKKPLSSDPKAPRLTRRQILVAGLVGLAVVGGGVRLAEVFISRSDQSTPPRSLSASLQYTYFDPHTDNSSKTGVLVTSVASSPNGKTIASASYDKTVKLWDPNTKDGSIRIFSGHTARVTSLAWSPNGKFIVSGSDDRTVRIWDVQSGKSALSPFSIISDHVLSVAWSPDGTHIAAGGADADKAVWVWDVSTRKLHRWQTTQVVWSVAWSNTGKDVAASNADGKLLIYNVVNDKIINPANRKSPGRYAKLRIAWSHNGKFLVAGSDDTMIHTWLWDANKGSPIFRELPGVYKGHTATVNSVDWSPDNQYLVSGSDDGTFCIWDASSISSSSVKKPLYQSPSDQEHSSVNAVAWLRDDSRRIAVGRGTGHIEIWQVHER